MHNQAIVYIHIKWCFLPFPLFSFLFLCFTYLPTHLFYVEQCLYVFYAHRKRVLSISASSFLAQSDSWKLMLEHLFWLLNVSRTVSCSFMPKPTRCGWYVLVTKHMVACGLGKTHTGNCWMEDAQDENGTKKYRRWWIRWVVSSVNWYWLCSRPVLLQDTIMFSNYNW